MEFELLAFEDLLDAHTALVLLKIDAIKDKPLYDELESKRMRISFEIKLRIKRLGEIDN